MREGPPPAERDAPAPRVAALWRYPVKSMGGEEVEEAEVGARGLAGDRAYAVGDERTGHVASAKHPRLWARLLECRASLAGPPRGGSAPPLRITLPDGRRVDGDDPRVHGLLSRLLGRPVRLLSTVPPGAARQADRSPPDTPDAGVVRDEPLALAAPSGTFFDVAPLHLLTTATLDGLAEGAPGLAWDARRFRPNVVVGGVPADGGCPEAGWLGATARVGSVALRVIDPTPRCVVTTLAQGGLPREPGVLRRVVRGCSAPSATVAPGVVFAGVAGVYARVEAPGTLRRGDPVTVG